MEPIQGELEKRLISSQLYPVGVDEVGRGCIAGPVYAACVSLDYEALLKLDPKERSLIRDSKTLSHKQRAKILKVIEDISIEQYIGVSDSTEIDSDGIVPATFNAMKRALESCQKEYGMVLVDGNRPITGFNGPQKTVVKGDSKCFSIAAASIVAKEARDQYMKEQAELYPQYGFEKHAGYGTAHHMKMMKEYGVCPIHRKSFAPVARCIPTR